MKNVVIAGYLRSPFTPASKGQLVKVHRKIAKKELLAEVEARPSKRDKREAESLDVGPDPE